MKEFIEQLKKIKPDKSFFLAEKADKGFNDYTFEELVKYIGYSDSVVMAKAYDWSIKYPFCRLVKDWRRIHSTENGYVSYWKFKKGSEIKEMSIKTDVNGVIEESGKNLKVVIAGLESDGWELIIRKFKKRIDG